MPQVNFGHVVVWAEAADRLVQGLELKGVCRGVVIECVAMGARTVVDKPYLGAVGLGNCSQCADYRGFLRRDHIIAPCNFLLDCLLH